VPGGQRRVDCASAEHVIDKTFCQRKRAKARFGVDMPDSAKVEEARCPQQRPGARTLEPHPWIRFAADERAVHTEWLQRQFVDDTEIPWIGRRHQQRRGNRRAASLQVTRKRQAAEAVGHSDPPARRRSVDRAVDATCPSIEIGDIPVLLLDAHRVGILRLQPGLPMRRPAVVQPGNDQHAWCLRGTPLPRGAAGALCALDVKP